jgi:hypothetical protein
MFRSRCPLTPWQVVQATRGREERAPHLTSRLCKGARNLLRVDSAPSNSADKCGLGPEGRYRYSVSSASLAQFGEMCKGNGKALNRTLAASDAAQASGLPTYSLTLRQCRVNGSTFMGMGAGPKETFGSRPLRDSDSQCGSLKRLCMILIANNCEHPDLQTPRDGGKSVLRGVPYIRPARSCLALSRAMPLHHVQCPSAEWMAATIRPRRFCKSTRLSCRRC